METDKYQNENLNPEKGESYLRKLQNQVLNILIRLIQEE
jgi:hypothetical protein